MIDLETWLNTYREAVLAAFGARVRFIGLQGSRARGEARAESDIDMVLILDRLEMEDLRQYRALGARLPDAAQAASLGACNLYHACCHNYLHEGDAEALRALYQSARFVLQAAVYARSGRYAASFRLCAPACGAGSAKYWRWRRLRSEAPVRPVSRQLAC